MKTCSLAVRLSMTNLLALYKKKKPYFFVLFKLRYEKDHLKPCIL